MFSNRHCTTRSQLPPFAGLVLAGGQSTRMGLQNKALVHYHNKPLIEYALERSLGTAKTKLISTGQHHYYPAALRHYLHLPDEGNQGPLAGIHQGLLWLNHQADLEWLAVCPCDTPLAPSDWTEHLLKPLSDHKPNKIGAAYVKHHGRDHYAHSIWHKSTLCAVTNALNHQQRAIKRVLTAIGAKAVDLTNYYPSNRFININTQSALANIERHNT